MLTTTSSPSLSNLAGSSTGTWLTLWSTQTHINHPETFQDMRGGSFDGTCVCFLLQTAMPTDIPQVGMPLNLCSDKGSRLPAESRPAWLACNLPRADGHCRHTTAPARGAAAQPAALASPAAPPTPKQCASSWPASCSGALPTTCRCTPLPRPVPPLRRGLSVCNRHVVQLLKQVVAFVAAR